jgi:hypothetical protein
MIHAKLLRIGDQFRIFYFSKKIFEVVSERTSSRGREILVKPGLVDGSAWLACAWLGDVRLINRRPLCPFTKED